MCERGGVGSDFDVKDTHRLVFEGEVVTRLGGDFDFVGGWRGEQSSREQNRVETLHRGIVALAQPVLLTRHFPVRD